MVLNDPMAICKSGCSSDFVTRVLGKPATCAWSEVPPTTELQRGGRQYASIARARVTAPRQSFKVIKQHQATYYSHF